MSNLFMNAWDGAAEIMVDPSKVQINAAGTNMTVATYNEERLNRGDKRPEYKNFHSLTFNKKDLAKMEGIFKDEQQKLKKKSKIRVRKLRMNKKVGRVLSLAEQGS